MKKRAQGVEKRHIAYVRAKFDIVHLNARNPTGKTIVSYIMKPLALFQLESVRRQSARVVINAFSKGTPTRSAHTRSAHTRDAAATQGLIAELIKFLFC